VEFTVAEGGSLISMSIETVKLFVINFEDSTTLADLALLFMDSGEVVAIRMKQGEKRKYALVEMYPYGAERAIADLDGKNWRGMRLQVMESQY
jgi:RNA recognition motif. (a.k.a. RRM, RBD, or RNP domain)